MFVLYVLLILWRSNFDSIRLEYLDEEKCFVLRSKTNYAFYGE